MPSAAEQVGTIIAGLVNGQNDIKENALPDEITQSILLSPQDGFEFTVEVNVYTHNYSSTAFILDHPVYGILDSSTLQLDGGYQSVIGFSLPVSMPVTFPAGGRTLHDTYTG
jgi:hypothetical protein